MFKISIFFLEKLKWNAPKSSWIMNWASLFQLTEMTNMSPTRKFLGILHGNYTPLKFYCDIWKHMKIYWHSYFWHWRITLYTLNCQVILDIWKWKDNLRTFVLVKLKDYFIWTKLWSDIGHLGMKGYFLNISTFDIQGIFHFKC